MAGNGNGTFWKRGEHAGSFYVHGGCATCPVPAAPEGQLTGAGLGAGGEALAAEMRREQIPYGGDSLQRGSVRGRGQGAAC